MTIVCDSLRSLVGYGHIRRRRQGSRTIPWRWTRLIVSTRREQGERPQKTGAQPAFILRKIRCGCRAPACHYDLRKANLR